MSSVAAEEAARQREEALAYARERERNELIDRATVYDTPRRRFLCDEEAPERRTPEVVASAAPAEAAKPRSSTTRHLS